jgi:hypothetical protein
VILGETALRDGVEVETGGGFVAEVVAGVIERHHRLLLLPLGAPAGDSDVRGRPSGERCASTTSTANSRVFGLEANLVIRGETVA